MAKTKKETAIRRLDKVLRTRFQGASITISWAEMDLILNKIQTLEMYNIIGAYNDGYNDAAHT